MGPVKEPVSNNALKSGLLAGSLSVYQCIKNPAIKVTTGMVTIDKTVEKANISEAYV